MLPSCSLFATISMRWLGFITSPLWGSMSDANSYNGPCDLVEKHGRENYQKYNMISTTMLILPLDEQELWLGGLLFCNCTRLMIGQSMLSSYIFPRSGSRILVRGTRCINWHEMYRICLWDMSRIFRLLNVLGIKVALGSDDLVSARVTFYFAKCYSSEVT